MSDLLTDGFAVLQRIPIKEIEERIAWLENALASYRTMAVVRRLMDAKPHGFETPPQWEPMIENHAPEPPPAVTPEPQPERRRRSPVQMRDMIAAFLRDKPSGALPGEISEGIGLTYACVYSHLTTHPSWYVKSDHKPHRWAVVGDGTRRDWLVEQLNGNGAP